ncbi:MAG: alpha/beta fold hydrolase [Steroidobacteraceae bacterium]
MIAPLHLEQRPRAPGPATTAGLPLVCLHGWGMNLRVFDLLRDALAGDCDTWAIDLAGHGRSAWNPARGAFDAQVEDVLAVLPERCVLLGWSFGGKLAIEIAVRAADRVAALALISTSPKFAQSPDWPHGMAAESLGAFTAVLVRDWQQTLEDFVWLQLRGSRNADSAQQVLAAALVEHGAPHPAALRNDLDLLATLDLRAGVPHITQPALLISGQNDRVTPPGAARWMAEQVEQAQLLAIPRAGHAAFVSHHEEVALALRGFLRHSAQAAA